MAPRVLSHPRELDADAAAAELRAVPLFADAPIEAVEALAASASRRTIEAGSWLFRAGDRPDAAYVVAMGRLRVIAQREDEEDTLRVVGPGALLGELGVLTNSPRSASVQAVRDSEVLELDAQRFADLVSAHAAFAAALARVLARQLQASGGLAQVAASPAVYAVVATAPNDAATAFISQFVDTFAAAGTATVLDEVPGTDLGRCAALVAAAEGRDERVLLVARDTASNAWRDFALRQSDRAVVVPAGRPPADVERLRACDLAFVADGSAPTISEWLDATSPRAHHVVQLDRDGDVARVVRRLTARSLGVVLSGGGARGFAHIGVIAALRAAGFEIDRVGGCSIGSFIGAMAAQGRSADEITDVCERELVRRAPFSDYTFPRVSLIRARRAASMLERIFGTTTIEELERPFYTVSADLLESRLVAHRRGPVYEAVGASMSIPGLAPPVPVGTHLLVDGGVLNNLPVDLMDQSEGPIVAVDVVRRMESQPDDTGAVPLPTIMETLSRATVLGSVERAEHNRRLATATIAPDVQAIGLRQFGALREAIEAGRRAAEDALAAGAGQALGSALH